MHANPSTAPTRAPTPPRKDLEREIMERLNNATLSQILKINSVIDAVIFHEVDDIKARLADPTTCTDERAILEPLLEQINNELDQARFKPLFTKQQVFNLESTAQQYRDARRRITLSVLCMTEKRLQHTALYHPEAFNPLCESVELFIDDSKKQLELAESAYHRLLLIGQLRGAEA